MSLRIEKSSQDDQGDALRLLLSRVPQADRPRHVAAWATALADNQTRLWIARRGSELVGTVLAQVQPGRTAVVLPPRVVASEPDGSTTELLAHVAGELGPLDVRILQAVLRPNNGEDAGQFAQAGYRHVSDLSCLVSLHQSFPSVAPKSTLEFAPYSAAGIGHLARIMEQTYEGSLDCTAVDRRRSIDDVLDGYRAIGQFDEAQWLVARHGDEDVGCLLLADHPGENGCELVYMGLKPAARGKRLGLELVRHAQWITAQIGRSRLTTAVDAANGPAIAIYDAAQFIEYDRRAVWLRIL